MRLRLLDEVVLVLANDRFAAWAVEVSLHDITIAQVAKMVAMDLYEVMRTTGAVRQFTGDPLPDEVLERILDNARFAPSGGNRQGTHVIAVRDAGTREAIIEMIVPAAQRYIAQMRNGEGPWNPVHPCGVDADTNAAGKVQTV
jgi:hypothetical protein